MATEILPKISHENGHDFQFIDVLASPDKYPTSETEKPYSVMNGPFIEVIGPNRELHTYIMPRVLKKEPVFNTPDINIFSLLEVQDNNENGVDTSLVQEIDLAQILGRDDLNFEDVRIQTFDLPPVGNQDRVVGGRFPGKRGVEIGESILCGVTAADHQGVPYVALFSIKPVLKEGEIQFEVKKENIEITDFTGKNVWPLGEDVVMFRREWTRKTEHKRRKKRTEEHQKAKEYLANKIYKFSSLRNL